jgi:galactofuranosylgalactofuranosylrhamnosyl-N-acetylglucosaminyl-diphospho-decaprenol beta-1,5/1,6-galactofuranosyltransferase
MAHVLQNLVLPSGDDRELGKLYVTSESGAPRVRGRHSVVLPKGSSASFATYFNAFPAAYWARSTGLNEVTLSVASTGSGLLRVHRSDAEGRVALVEGRRISDGTSSVVVSIAGTAGGGWIWFDVVADDADLTIDQATWSTEREPHRAQTAVIGMTTHDKPDWCVRTLGALGAAELEGVLAQILVVDQGTRLVADEPGFETACAVLGDRLAIVHQPNLGGSGGFARAMLEAQRTRAGEFVLLLDDDVRIEPEAIRRAIVFASYCADETIVGGHMLDLLAPTMLYAWAEIVDEVPFMWRPQDEDRMPVDFASADLRDLPLVHRRLDADYNGWWMCLIPRATIERIGLPIPAFIKWDDAEYGLRARAQGIPTVSLPGAALWHVSWVGKDDQVDWQAYFHTRNRIVAALLHSSAPGGGTLLKHSRRVDVKHFLAMQYYPVAIRHRALRDVLSGPAHMHAQLAEILPWLRSTAEHYPETAPATGEFRATRSGHWQGDAPAPTGARLAALLTRSLVLGWVRRPRAAAQGTVEVDVTAAEGKWWRLATFDSAIVRTAHAAVPRRYVRDRSLYRRQVADSLRLHRALAREWDRLRDEYRAAPLTTVEAWEGTFQAAGGAPHRRRAPWA